MMNANLFAKANRIVQSCDAVYLGILDESGSPNVSTVSPIKPENIFEAYFATGMNENKARRIRADKRASVCYRAGDDNVTLVGEAEILTYQETKSRLWLDWFIDHIPGGETDPNYCIIKFTAKRASLWIDNEVAAFTIFPNCRYVVATCPKTLASKIPFATSIRTGYVYRALTLDISHNLSNCILGGYRYIHMHMIHCNVTF